MRPDDEWQQDSERNSSASYGDETRAERKSFNPNFTPDNQLRKPRRRIGDTRIDMSQNASYSTGRSYQRPQSGYNNRGGYGSQGGYDRYHSNDDSARQYGQSQGGYDRPMGGYNRGGYNQDGGYNRQGGYGNQGGGYRQQGGGYNRQGGYGNQGGYRQQGGGYNRQGGYGQQSGGYRQQGGRPQQSNFRRPQPNNGHKQIEYKSIMIDPSESIRLNKYLANAGVCSRREADELISAGAVTVNGVAITELGTKILRGDRVMVGDQLVSPDKLVYILLNKPKGCVTSTDDPNAKLTVMKLVEHACKERIYPVGRLDRNTTGVLLLTNDGDLASKLTHPMYNKKKIYQVNLEREITPEEIEIIRNGVELEDGPIKPDEVSFIDDADHKKVGIEIHSGRNRIVRRIFEKLGVRVCKLDRVFFAGLTKKGLKRGAWRFLTEREVSFLRMGAFE